VGPAGETDQELLRTTEYLRRNVNLARTYFSRFNPVPDTPLEDQPAESPVRERRLYQGDFLLRDYGFRVDELVFDGAGNLPKEEDPKVTWARRHLAEAPVELNRADEHELLRVPGLGPVGVKRVLQARRQGRLRELHNLRHGRRPAYQLRLW
jgi:predicted DNA-binding helix-hairpin-helix protein